MTAANRTNTSPAKTPDGTVPAAVADVVPGV